MDSLTRSDAGRTDETLVDVVDRTERTHDAVMKALPALRADLSLPRTSLTPRRRRCTAPPRSARDP